MVRMVEEANKPYFLTKGHTPEMASVLSAASRTTDEDMFIFPNVRATDPDWLKACYSIFYALQQEFPASEMVDGVYTGDAISGDFTKLLTVAGHPQRPMGAPIKDAGTSSVKTMEEWNRLWPTRRRTAWLAGGFEKSELDILDWLMDRYCIKNGATSIHINAKSSLGLPSMARETGDGMGLRARAGAVKMWLEHGPQIMEMLRRGQMKDLYLIYNLIFAYVAKNRLQNDKWVEAPPDWKGLFVDMPTPSGIKRMIPKDRKVYSAYRDEVVIAAKTLSIGPHLFSRKRTRPVAAVAWPAAAPLVGLAHIVARGMYTDAIFKTRGADDLCERLEIKAPRDKQGRVFRRRGDVSQSDANQPVQGLRRVLSKLEEHYGALGSLAAIFFKCPCLCPPDEAGAKPVWTGSPFDLGDFTSSYVIPSGHPLTTVVTTILNLWHLLCGMVAEYGYGFSDLDALLKGSHPDFVMFVGGDNVALSGRREIPPFELLMMPVPCEETDRIMGFIPIRDGTGRVRYVPDIRGLFDKIPPERKWDSKIRKYPAYGYFQQKEIYSAHPSAEGIYAILNWGCKKHLGTTMDDIWRQVYKAPELSGHVITPEEAYLILKPEAIHYMDFDPRILAVIGQEMPFPFDQEEFVSMCYGLGTMDPFNSNSWL